MIHHWSLFKLTFFTVRHAWLWISKAVASFALTVAATSSSCLPTANKARRIYHQVPILGESSLPNIASSLDFGPEAAGLGMSQGALARERLGGRRWRSVASPGHWQSRHYPVQAHHTTRRLKKPKKKLAGGHYRRQ